jgi:hypothetical protein
VIQKGDSFFIVEYYLGRRLPRRDLTKHATHSRPASSLFAGVSPFFSR